MKEKADFTSDAYLKERLVFCNEEDTVLMFEQG